MTIDQMHIEIDQGVQEMGSKTWDMFEPEHVDLVINKIINSYINGKVFGESDNTGAPEKTFYVDQSVVDPIRTLLVKDREIPLSYNKKVVGGEYYSPLPNDFRYLVKAKSEVNYSCNDIENFSNQTAPYSLSILSLDVLKNDINIYDFLSILINNNKVVEYEKQFSYKDIYRAIDYIVSSSDNIYWERYGNIYRANSFIVLTNGTALLNIGNKKSVLNTKLYNSRQIISSPESLDTRISKHEFYSPTDFDDLDDDPFARTSYSQPNSSIYDHTFYTKVDNSFLLISTKIDYIRNPRPVDINLGIHCELPSSAHPDIVDRSVKHILSIIQNAQKYQLSIAELLNR